MIYRISQNTEGKQFWYAEYKKWWWPMYICLAARRTEEEALEEIKNMKNEMKALKARGGPKQYRVKGDA